MGKFKHHSYFQKEKHIQSYLFPNLCFKCRKSFKKPQSSIPRVCPEYGGPLIEVNRKFSAPKTADKAQWEKVKYLVENGFFFHSVYERAEDGGYYKISYPESLDEAKDFVIRYKEQAVNQAF